MSSKHRDGTAERRHTNQPPANKELSLGHSSLLDILSPAHHSKDFCQTRNKYIVERLRLMCLFFAISVPLSSLFDFIIFDKAQAQVLFFNRIMLTIALLLLFKFIQRVTNVRATHAVLALSFLLPTCFYIATSLALDTGYPQQIPLSFSMMPYLIIAMLGLFPLTISGGLGLLSIITAPLFAFEYVQLSGDVVGLIDKMWLLVLFGGISLWLQSGQLLMLMKLYRESTIDPLTGLINRRVLMRQASNILNKCQSDNETFCVMMFDLDHFKRVNDTYGHLTGDKVLVKIASLLKQELRNADVIARFGGEEFLVVLPHLQLEQTTHVAQRIASAVRNSSIRADNAEQIKFTTSIGVAQYNNKDTIDSLFKRVDDLLYNAKKGGRDRVVSEVYSPDVDIRKVS